MAKDPVDFAFRQKNILDKIYEGLDCSPCPDCGRDIERLQFSLIWSTQTARKIDKDKNFRAVDPIRE